MIDVSWVTNRVATGTGPNRRVDVEGLLAAGLNVVVDARQTPCPGTALTGQIHYLHNPCDDDGEPKPVEYWERTLAFVMPLLARPGFQVLLNCFQGINRGPSNALCVLVAQGLPPDTAEAAIRAARPGVGLAYKADAVAACRALGWQPRLAG